MQKQLIAKETNQLRRSKFNGAIMRVFGFKHWAIEYASTGLSVLGRTQIHIPYSELSKPVALTKALGFTAITLSLKSSNNISVAGLKSSEATKFVTAANGEFCQRVAEKFKVIDPEIRAVSDALVQLGRQYPSACLVAPLLTRAEKILELLPVVIPDGAIVAEQQNVLDKVLAFKNEPARIRDAAINKFVEAELAEMKTFFDTIESNPLTPEQRLAVVTDEDATLVLAGAGSGKTSVIVAKAAYLVEREIRQPEEILLMSFGKDAAAEMAARIQERSGAAVDALTFHALGNKIIRDVAGKAPALASHASDEVKFRVLLRDIIINDVAKQPGLGNLLLKWFSEFYFPYKSEWDFKSLNEYYLWLKSNDLRTLSGDRVKSYEEWEIANWLYLNGIEFEYEPVYEHDLPVDARGAYTPDFRLKESGVYIEHFGVRKSRGPDGSTILRTAPHIDSEKYLNDMAWKRDVHADNGTTLVETFSYERVEGRLLDSLKEKLALYVELKPVPQDQVLDTLSKMGQVDAFTQTLGVFLRHFKSSGASLEQCRGRIQGNDHRGHAFLMIFEAVFGIYQKRLGDQIDFEDMINLAAEHVESGRYQSPYHHLLVDEFQDISEGRARLLSALKEQHADARIFAVGDDWQSIFRFAGSDIHLMRDFGSEFGGVFADSHGVHSTVDLGRTFRSVDKIALPARRFVLQNPSQIEKNVITIAKTDAPSIMISYYDRNQEDAALKATLAQISETGTAKKSVLLLGRYNFLRPKNLEALIAEFPNLSLRFMTVHGSKGLEADHVVILRAVSDTMGFPSQIVDDPLLDLVLPKPENFSHAEERRLFYVALTRARKSVRILADRENPSVFIRELVKDPAYEAIQIDNSGIIEHQCGVCGGRMLRRDGKNGSFYFSCEHRPLCGAMLRSCNVCGEDLPVRNNADSDILVCSCGEEFPACQDCSDGWLVERTSRYGKFLGCVKYPECAGKRQYHD